MSLTNLSIALLQGWTAAQWTSNNPVLPAYSLGVESDSLKAKFGDGSTAWSSLSYFDPSGGVAAAAWGSITGTLSAQSDLNTALGLKAALISPSFTTPALGTPSAGVLTNCTGTASGLTAGNATLATTVTTNANLTGDVTSVGNAATLAAVLRKQVTADVTNATATMANLTDLSVTLAAAGVYVGQLVLKCSNSTAAEGISVDFDGSAATMTAFAAGAGLLTGGTTVAATTVSSALATDLNWTTITGETWLVIQISLTVNAGGTFIPRFCEGTAHSAGTATVSRGSYLILTKI